MKKKHTKNSTTQIPPTAILILRIASSALMSHDAILIIRSVAAGILKTKNVKIADI